MNGDALQDDGLAKLLVDHQARLESERAAYEPSWREVEERVDPELMGGFTKQSPSTTRGAENFDSTAVMGLDRAVAAMGSVTVPRGQTWHGLRFSDPELDKLPEVRRWCEDATDRLFAMRYVPAAGFETNIHADLRQSLSYGTAPLWVDEDRGKGIFYKALHLSEAYIDVDYRGYVDTVHRKFELSARQCAQMFGEANLSPKMRKAIDGGKGDSERFQILHAVRPNPSPEPDRLDARAKPIQSPYLAVDEKWFLRRGGYHSMPVMVSRHLTSPGAKYGSSPALKVMPTIKTANVIARTLLRAGHKATDPALMFYDDDGITSIATKPGGMNPGLVNDQGQPLVHAMPTGTNLPIGMELLENERGVIRTAFLEDFFRIITNPSDRMTATQVLEMVAKQGTLIAPFAGKHETEKLAPMIERELDIALRAGWIEPPPPVVREAMGRRSVTALVHFENPLSRMARAEEAAGLVRWIEAMTPLSQVAPEVFDHIDVDQAPVGLADVLGVRPSWIAPAEKVAAKRQARAEQQDGAMALTGMTDAAKAYLDVSKANAIAEGGAA